MTTPQILVPYPTVKAIGDARAGRLAGAAGQAAIEVQLGTGTYGSALEDLLHEVDASTGAVQLIAEELIRRTRRGAKAAMHACAQYGIGLSAFWRRADEIGEPGLHLDAQSSG